MVSAIQIGGRRLHELARAGMEVERQPRPVEVFRLEVTDFEERRVSVGDRAWSNAPREPMCGFWLTTLPRLWGAGLTSKVCEGRGSGPSGSKTRSTSGTWTAGKTNLLPLSAAVGTMPRLSIDDEQRQPGNPRETVGDSRDGRPAGCRRFSR